MTIPKYDKCDCGIRRPHAECRKVIYATDKKCCECGEQAAVFWPCIDPDIRSHPFCRKCADKAQTELLVALSKDNFTR